MRTYLQKKLTGTPGQLVVFGSAGQAEAGDLPDSLFPCLRVTIIWGRVAGPITLTAVCGGTRVVRTVEHGQDEALLYLRENGLWKLDAAEDSGTMIGTHREIQVDAVKDYQAILGVETELRKNTPELIREACLRGVGERLWQVGDELDLKLKDGRTLTMQLYGFRHDNLSVGGKALATFGTRDCVELKAYSKGGATNQDGWARSDLRKELLAWAEELLPAQWRSIIKKTRKLTTAGSKSSRLEISDDLVFLFSAEEAGGEGALAGYGEGTRYPIFTDTVSRQKKDLEGKACSWWLRSPAKSSGSTYHCVSMKGYIGTQAADAALPLAFGFSI